MVKCSTCNKLMFSVEGEAYCEKGHFCEVIDIKFRSKLDVEKHICEDRYCDDHFPFDWDPYLEMVREELIGDYKNEM